MRKQISIFSLLLFSTCSQAAIDTITVSKEAASVSSLAGRIGEAVMLSVQADDDNDLEIFTTVSSDIDKQNDYWILLDWDSTNSDYKITNTGNLQAENNAYLSSYQVSNTEILLGQQNGGLTTITFVDDIDSEKHTLNEKRTQLSDLPHILNSTININTDIKAIVTLKGTDQKNYTVICTDNLIHILNSNSLEFTLDKGGYCQSGNIDKQKINDNYDQELITQDGSYFNFDGSHWQEKNGLSNMDFGDNFLVANIYDNEDEVEIIDKIDEVLTRHQLEQVHAFSPSNNSLLNASHLSNAKGNFNTSDIDGDGIHEIFFDSQSNTATSLNKFIWGGGEPTSVETQNVKVLKMRRLATSLSAGNRTNFYLFASKADTTNPNTQLLTRLNEGDLSITWQGLFGTNARSFDVIAKTVDGNSIQNHSMVQLEQIDVGVNGVNDYKYAYKFLAASNFSFEKTVEPDFTSSPVTRIDSLTTFDFNGNKKDELHSGGQSSFNQGIVISSLLNGDEYNVLHTPSIESVTALSVSDINPDDNGTTPDIIATGKQVGADDFIGIHTLYDGINESIYSYRPASGDTNFNKIVTANIKGDDDNKLEVLGLHSQLLTYNPDQDPEKVSFYNLSNIDLTQLTPVTLKDHKFQYALTSDALGKLHLIDPSDLSILTPLNEPVCDSELIAIASLQVKNEVTIALAICKQELLSWVIEFNDEPQRTYNFHALTPHKLDGLDTSTAKLIALQTIEQDENDNDENQTHVFALFNNTFKRLELNRDLGADIDGDGYFSYQDEFPNEPTQWADTDKDLLGDNPAPAENFDPSLNDIDNDGVKDDSDPDNNPVNDFDPSNDIDHGLPYFSNTPLPLEKAEYAAELTSIRLTAPTANDLYDTGSPTISASVDSVGLSVFDAFTFEANLVPGKHDVIWQAQDIQGNKATKVQKVWVYPNVAFSASAQRIGETQLGKVKLVLSGVSPEYPVTVKVRVSGGDISNDELTQDITQNLTVTFNEGETEAFVKLNFLDDKTKESDETIELTIVDTFASTAINPSWTIDDENNTTIITVADLNEAPSIGDLSISQNNVIVPTPNNIDGSAALSVSLTDTNTADEHSFSWNLESLGLGTVLLPTASFDANKVEPGLYFISITVTDNGLPNLLTTKTFSLAVDYGDTDKDGVKDNVDAFPNNSSETLDTDGDGVGNNADAFPRDASETVDSDGDKVGNNTDVFPNNAAEFKDSDGDGVGDNGDAFPEDPTESEDTDGDSVGNKADAFPDNAAESKDSDGDGIGDNADTFPTDVTETNDTDTDGTGDNSDEFPQDPERSAKLADQSLEGSGSGSLNYFLLLFLLPITLYRRKKS
jgi:hypothetical protein